MDVRRAIPALNWITQYRRSDLGLDLTAGLTVAVILVPQAMAYAMLAGLPPVVGLYASMLPLALYAVFGTSRQLAVGPVAMVSLLVASGTAAVADPGSPEWLAAAVALAALSGVIQLGMGVLRLGFLVNFLSHPVVSGFTSAAALIIGFSQLQHLLGVAIPRSDHVHEILAHAWAARADVHVPTVLLGVGSVVALLAFRRLAPRFPAPLAVVGLATVLVAALGLDQGGMSVVGEVPSGLPRPSWPRFDLTVARALLPAALTISLLGFMESVSVAKVFAARHRYRLDPDQELIALGAANLGAALFGGYPVAGGFSRSAVKDQTGARTPLSSLVTAGFVALSLLFLTPLFVSMPEAVLAAIIMVAVFGLVDFAEVRHLWHVKRSDLVFLAITFVATLSLGIEAGIGVGVLANLGWFLFKRTRPHFAVLGRLPGTRAWRNLTRYPEAEPVPGLLVLRFDAAFTFGNVSFVEERLAELEERAGGPLRAVVLDASGFNDLDSSGARALQEIIEDHHRRGIRLLLAGCKGPVRDVLARAGLDEALGRENLALDVEDAVRAAARRPTAA